MVQHARPEQLGHAGVDFDETVAFCTGVNDIHDIADQRAGIGNEVRAGFDFKVKFAAVLLLERFEIFHDRRADFL